MQELICIEAAEWELTISCQHLEARQKTYFDMLNRRGDIHRPNKLQFQPAICPTKITVCEQNNDLISDSLLSGISLPKPLFFENALYQFEWVFLQDDIEQAYISHALQSISDSFRFTTKRKHSAASLIGSINTGNDIGRLSLPLIYGRIGDLKKVHLTLDVLPTKMQLHNDLPAMYQCIDETFPLWRFSLAEKTEQNADKSHHRGKFPLLWLAQFKALRERLEQGLNVISNSPHNRLQSKTHHIKADRLKGKLNHRLAEKIREDLVNKDYDRRYKQDKKYLSVNTPENSFIKMVVIRCKQQLEEISNKLESNNKNEEGTYSRLSTHFLSELKEWQKPLIKMERHSFLKEVDDFTGLQRESLVLQQKTGYKSVYKAWQELKYYLDVFARQSSVSMKSVAETYEVWCFLTVRKMMTDVLGFEEVLQNKTKLRLNDYFELQLEDGLSGAGAFVFERSDGLKARLAHEPIFRRNGADIRSFWVTQKPDILLEVTFADSKKCIWLFDAKYRIKTKSDRFESDDIDQHDFVPDDAINQMHRYRDALIRIDEREGQSSKSRPVFGAFALYPGFFDQSIDSNPYQAVINEVGIGAFPLLPSAGDNKNNWLEDFLIEHLGLPSHSYSDNHISDALYVNEPARIPYSGMKQMLHPDLVLTARLGNGRSQVYVDNFKSGNAKWFHMPVSVFYAQFGKHIAQEVSYLAIAQVGGDGLEITNVYRVKNVMQRERSKISAEQSGANESQVNEELYWLFELGEVLVLNQPVVNMNSTGFRQSLKLTTLNLMQEVADFYDLKSVYEKCVA